MFSSKFLNSLNYIGYRCFHRCKVDRLCTNTHARIEAGMKILNVAEKNDAAKNLAGYLSGGNLRRVSTTIGVIDILFDF